VSVLCGIRLPFGWGVGPDADSDLAQVDRNGNRPYTRDRLGLGEAEGRWNVGTHCGDIGHSDRGRVRQGPLKRKRVTMVDGEMECPALKKKKKDYRSGANISGCFCVLRDSNVPERKNETSDRTRSPSQRGRSVRSSPRAFPLTGFKHTGQAGGTEKGGKEADKIK